MARKPREDSPGSWHHVINRGIAKRLLFEDRSDMRFFLARLVRQIRLGRIEIHAYCLMNTHFHLLVRSPRGEMSEALRRAQNEHSRRFNRLRKRDGALIRGRYFSKLVDTVEYRRNLVSYIDSNPVRAGIVGHAAEYEFCSAAAYLAGAGPRWLTRGWVEEEARRCAGEERFTPAAYLRTFGNLSHPELEDLEELVEARTRSRAQVDPLDDLLAASSSDMLSWMQWKAGLADGHVVGLPVCGPRALRRVLDGHVASEGTWMVEDGRKAWNGAELAWIGLLRDLCSLTWREIAALEEGAPLTRVRRADEVYRRLLLADPDHARRVAAVVRSAIPRR